MSSNPLIERDHAALVSALVKPGADVLRDLCFERLYCLVSAIDMMQKAGELLDGAKKIAIYAKPWNSEVPNELMSLGFPSRLRTIPFVSELTPDEADALHMAVGIAGEAAELLQAIAAAVIDRKPLDRENVVEELGDLEFYVQGLRSRLHIRRDETLVANGTKLLKRYPAATYSNAAAAARLDKIGEEAAAIPVPENVRELLSARPIASSGYMGTIGDDSAAVRDTRDEG